MIDYVVDETMQIYAGYGFVEEYRPNALIAMPASTASSRHERNQPADHHRLPAERAMSGQLPLMPAIRS